MSNVDVVVDVVLTSSSRFSLSVDVGLCLEIDAVVDVDSALMLSLSYVIDPRRCRR